METKTKKGTVAKHNRETQIAPETQPLLTGAETIMIPVSSIDFSPLNYRKVISEEALQSFAAELRQHGIISALLVRPKEGGRYELVAGERRLRAAIIAELSHVPATVKVLSDEEVTEIQLSENLQREDPHPLDEARAIGIMMKAHKSVDEISARLGKSKPFIYSRMKLLSLIESFQEMLLANAIQLREALEIALLSSESQQQLYEQECKSWKAEKHFQIYNLSYLLRRYRCDLKNAPFNTKDTGLIPDVGACSKCPFNSGTLKSLFPDYAKEAVCTNSSCYQKKCDAHMTTSFTAAFVEHTIDAILVHGTPSRELLSLLVDILEAKTLPIYNRYEVCEVRQPEMPRKEDFMEEEDGEEPQFDEEAYNDEMVQYDIDSEEYTRLFNEGKVLKGVFIHQGRVAVIDFALHKDEAQANTAKVTAKEVQEAIRAKTATPELLQSEIARITEREMRLQELDAEKVQLAIHEAFNQQIQTVEGNQLTDADLTAARLLIYLSLDYTARTTVHTHLGLDGQSDLVQRLATLTEVQYSYLIGMAISTKADCKHPRTGMGECLRLVAESAGVDVGAIKQRQAEKAQARQEKQGKRTKELAEMIEKLKE